MVLTDKLLTELQRRLKIGNRRGVHLNAIPSNSRYKFDITRLSHLDKGLPSAFVSKLLTDQPLRFKISWKDNVADLNSLFEEEQLQLARITKGFENLINQTEAIESEKGINTFGFGFPVLIRRDQADNKLTVAPILIWSLRIKRTKEFNTWEIQRSDEDPIYINEVLLNHLQNDAKVEVQQIPTEMLEDGLIDKAELITICSNLLRSINPKVDDDIEDIFKDKIENVNPIRDRIHYEGLPISSTNALIEFGGLFSIFEVQKQSIINEYDHLLKLKGLSINLGDLENHSFQPISSIETDPSQQGILHGLEKERNILIQGPPGTGKSQTLTAILINALENHKKTIVVCEKRTALEVLHNALIQKGLGFHCVLIKDIVKDRKLVVDSVRERVDNSSYRRYRYEYSKESLDILLKKVSKIIKGINKGHAKLDQKVIGSKEWTHVVGMFLREMRGKSKVPSLDLNKGLFEFSIDEISDIADQLEEAQSLYEAFEPYMHRTFLNSEKLVGENAFEIEASIHSDFAAYEKSLRRLETLEADYKSFYLDFRNSEWKAQILAIDEIQKQILEIVVKHQTEPDFLNERRTNSFIYKILSLFSKSRKLIREDQHRTKGLFNKLKKVCALSRDIGDQQIPNSISESVLFLNVLMSDLKVKSSTFSEVIAQEYDQLELLKIESAGLQSDSLNRLKAEFVNLKALVDSAKWTTLEFHRERFRDFIKGLNDAIDWKKEYFEDDNDMFIKEFRWFRFYNGLGDRDAEIIDELKGHPEWKKTFLCYYLNEALASVASGDLPTDEKEHLQLKESFKGIQNEQLRYINEYWYSNQIDLTREFEAKNNLTVENLYNKKSSHRYRRLSLRQIVQYDPDLFTTFFPIVLTTPDVCCNLFSEMNHYFDLVMFDEASQLRLEDNLPALLKGKQIVIAGDEHQMPPSNYFSKVFDGSVEDEDELEEENEPVNIDKENLLLSCESLLDFGTELNFNKRFLDFHYRSRHPFLIDFSNHAFYKKRLRPLPNDFVYSPIKYVQVDGTFSEHTNEAEAEMVLSIIENNILRFPDGKYPTVGVATFNIAQRNLIKSKLLERQRFSRFESFNEKIQELEEDGLFIKNLENIQGDERDVIIISTTYGLGKDGKFAQRFGPINHSKGYKLLNVIITRAKYKVYVCSSVPEPVFMNYKDYLATDGNNRRGIFYAYLAYSKAVSSDDNESRLAVLQTLSETTSTAPSSVLDHLGNLESPFEEEVFQEISSNLDKSTLQVQFPYAGFKIDIVYTSKTPGVPKIAIECDGAKYHTSREAYLHDWHRQRILEQHGFVFHRIWSTNWWRNPKRETKRLLDFIRTIESGEKRTIEPTRLADAFNDEVINVGTISNAARVEQRKATNAAIRSFTDKIAERKEGIAVNDKVKLKYVNNGKDVHVTISASSTSSRDGVQFISPNSPLAVSILGRRVGDIVKVGNLDNFVEILEIVK
ncbi:MAG: GreA/GreB family elongation factor [Cyclobacteriaceae bacterium]|nr:GreA/GreB family elongation factor [Cyclobacteriaceae bacterium]